MNLKPIVAQMAFATKRKDRRAEIIANLLLFGIISYAHPNMVLAIEASKATVIFHSTQDKVGRAYHHMLNGSSKRTIKIPLSIFRARSPKACFPW
jgi:hypothetical protein